MNRVKRFLMLILILSIGLFGYSKYTGIPISDTEALFDHIRKDVVSIIGQGEEADNSSSVTEPNLAQEEEDLDKGSIEKKEEPQVRITIPRNPFESIDKYARSCPDTAEISTLSLANYLGRKSRTNLEKARAIYVWLTNNIKYDDNGFNSGLYSGTSAEDVLKNRKAVCEGYSNLYLELGNLMSLDIIKIAGYAKGYGYRPGMNYSAPNHAWNAIKIDGHWRIFDATWGSGNGENIGGKLVSNKDFDDYWFNIDPYEAVFNHYPEDKKLSFVSPMISLEEYEGMPFIDKGFLELLGNGQEIYDEVRMDLNTIYPKSYPSKIYIKAVKLEKNGKLEVGKNASFVFHAPQAQAFAIIDSNKNWTYFEEEGGAFKLDFDIQSVGKISVGVRRKGHTKFEIILEYEVVEGGDPS